MGGLCIYSSAVTHYGLQELCLKLGEITGSSTCTYTVNVATLTYERRIRGVYQATRLTIVSAWLHTACWLLSALLALVRILLAVDFQLVCVHVQLHGDIEKILENDEVQIRTVSPDIWAGDSDTNFHNKPRLIFADYQDEMKTLYDDSEVSRRSQSVEGELSTISLVPEERKRLVLMEAFKSVDNAHKFIVRYLYDLLDALILPGKSREASAESTISRASDSSAGSRKLKMNRQYGQEHIVYEPLNSKASVDQASYISEDVEEIVKSESLQSVDRGAKPVEESYYIRGKVIFDEQPTTSKALEQPAEPEPQLKPEANLSVKIKDDLNKHDKKKKSKKSNLKTIGVQTSKDRKPKRNLRVKITEVERESEVESESDSDSTPDLKDDVDKETQTAPKEKQD
ncbi:unnamed protein product [Chrysodeixis includens]|uniref:Uncharacterized protein n=1 Tax=Chrysodeixis includens TaxID=689277 RepID=A0A9P0BVR7_CHRIL|nr:unnamed protein product [Chrysodeixis includens]